RSDRDWSSDVCSSDLGKANWTFGTSSGDSSGEGGSSDVQIGTLTINDGQVHARSEKLAADFQVAVSTRSGGDAGKDELVASAKEIGRASCRERGKRWG